MCTNYSALMKYFPQGYVINYKTCTLLTHSSLCPFAPFVFASTLISLYSLALSSEIFSSHSLCLACIHLVSPPHFVYYVALPSSFSSFIPGATLFLIYSPASAVYLRVSVCLFRSLHPHISLCGEFCTEDSLVLLLRSLQLLEAFMWSFSLAPAEYM